MQVLYPEFRTFSQGCQSHVAACFQFSSDLRRKERFIQLRQRGPHVTTASRRHSTGCVQSSATRTLCFDQARSTPESSARLVFLAPFQSEYAFNSQLMLLWPFTVVIKCVYVFGLTLLCSNSTTGR